MISLIIDGKYIVGYDQPDERHSLKDDEFIQVARQVAVCAKDTGRTAQDVLKKTIVHNMSIAEAARIYNTITEKEIE